MKKVLKVFLGIIIAVIALAAMLLIFLTVTEYKPKETEEVLVEGNSQKMIRKNQYLSVLSWNIGYSALGQYNDFPMDGGNTPPADKITVHNYYLGILNTIEKQNPSIINLQEVDVNSSRSFNKDQREEIMKGNGTFALNYKCKFVPFPFPPMGKINSGLFTTSDYKIDKAERISLPCPFAWPLRTANLRRGLLVNYFPVENTGKYLVFINFHLEAYTEEEGRLAQLKVLNELLENEYEKGNYVIACGDFNQLLPGSEKVYPNTHRENWNPNALDFDSIPEHFDFYYDTSVPSCRLLNGPYNPQDKEQTQYYTIDGYIVSDNITVFSVKTLDSGFENSDHNPVRLTFSI